MSFDEFKRPPPNATGDLLFQLVDIDYSVEKVVDGYTPITKGRSPILRLFGVTADGNSVSCIVHGFYPYLYLEANTRVSLEECEMIREALNDAVSDDVKSQNWSPEYVLSVEPTEKMNIYGYRTTKSQYLKVTTMIPKHVPIVKRLVEKNQIQVDSIPGLRFQKTTFESSLVFVTRFMTDVKIDCGGWISIKQGHYSTVTRKTTTAQIEVNAMYTDVHNYELEEIAPWRSMYFDIECDAQPNTFPNAIRDPVCTVSAYLVEYGKNKDARKVRFQLKDCDPTPGVKIYQFETEREMLRSIKDFIVAYDPDLMLGWNILTFDFPYLLDRAVALGVKEFKQFSRVYEYDVSIRDETFESKAYGKRNSKKITCAGRVPFDTMVYVMREKKYRSYSLNAVSRDLLGKSKKDLDYKLIHVYQNENSAKRKVIGDYCDWDSYLPYEISEKLSAFTNCIGMMLVCHVTMNMLLTQGQQVKIISLLHRFANPEDYIIPTTADDDKASPGEGKAYDGAVVIEPTRGYYDENSPVTTLDFSSLYPSIMMSYNLCYSTLIPRSDWANHDDSIYHTTPYDNCRFVNSNVKRGILPRILEQVVGKRKEVRAVLEKEPDPLRKAILDGRQNALKVTANSVYGFTGALVGKLPCIEISASVTAYGRQMIMTTKKFIEDNYTKGNGYEDDAQVIYGDTDSVMVIFIHYKPLDPQLTEDQKKEAFAERILAVSKLGVEACGRISDLFTKPVKLEFEKVYCPYLLVNKKRYAGDKWTKDKQGKLVHWVEVKGMETVRRDSCPLVKTLLEKVLAAMIVERNLQKSMQLCIETISDLVRGKIDVSQLVITKAFSKKEEDYKSKQVHVEMIKRIQERDPSFNPSLGDRIPYVMIKKDLKGAKKFEMSEDPMFAIKNNLRLDYQFYIDNQLKKPLTRIFQYVMKNVDDLFTGDHTKYVNRIGEGDDPTKNTITKYFTQKLEQCLSCRVSLPKKRPLCTHCGDDSEIARKVYKVEMDRHRENEKRFSQTWSICGRCQSDNGGKLMDPNVCTNIDCSVLFARTKAEVDLNISNQRVQRFSDW